MVEKARTLLATYENMAELIRLGAYRRGSDPAVDEAIQYQAKLDAFLAQEVTEPVTFEECYAQLAEILGEPPVNEPSVSEPSA